MDKGYKGLSELKVGDSVYCVRMDSCMVLQPIKFTEYEIVITQLKKNKTSTAIEFNDGSQCKIKSYNLEDTVCKVYGDLDRPVYMFTTSYDRDNWIFSL